MQRYNIVHHYNYPIKTVTKLLMEHDPPIYDLVDLPNVSTNKLLNDRWEGDKRYLQVEWCVHGQIPKLAQKIIKPDMLTFVEDSIWDGTKLTYTTRIIPHHFKNQINAQHRVTFTDAGDGRTKRVLSGIFEVKIPLIGLVFEIAILQQLKDNCEADFKISASSLKQFIEKNGDPYAEAK